MKLAEIVEWADGTLRTAQIEDYPNAHNGLQLENAGGVARIAAAVDACEAVIEMAVEAGADLLMVHHGLLWGGAQRIEGAFYRKLRLAIEHDLAIYSAHLPLDQHPALGNNALLAKAIGVRRTAPFLGIGVRGSVNLPLAALIDRVERAVNAPVHVAPGGPERIKSIGIVTGGGGDWITKIAPGAVDAYLTGEGSHWTYAAAEERGINLLYAGHYATETFGVKALAAAASARFGVPWEFIDHPTGL
jgi:dinuclear metal center YbgI/SA1388 family protein